MSAVEKELDEGRIQFSAGWEWDRMGLKRLGNPSGVRNFTLSQNLGRAKVGLTWLMPSASLSCGKGCSLGRQLQRQQRLTAQSCISQKGWVPQNSSCVCFVLIHRKVFWLVVSFLWS